MNILIVFKCVQGLKPKFPDKATDYSFPVSVPEPGTEEQLTVNPCTMDRNINEGADLWFKVWIFLKGIFFLKHCIIDLEGLNKISTT